jgi:hypothetical protein
MLGEREWLGLGRFSSERTWGRKWALTHAKLLSRVSGGARDRTATTYVNVVELGHKVAGPFNFTLSPTLNPH